MKARLGATTLATFGVFGALSFAGCSGTEVQGIVREEATGEPLSGATVRVGDETVRTDEGGVFEVEVDDDAPALIEVEAVGYEPQQVDLDMQDGAPLPADIGLAQESDERVQTRARFAEEQRRLEEAERKLEADEYELYKARRDFRGQGVPAAQRDQTMQQFDAWERRLEAAEEKHEAEERALYEARRDFDAGNIDTWTAPTRTDSMNGSMNGATNDDAAEDAQDAAEERAERAKDESEDAADRIRKADEEAAERAEEQRERNDR